MRGSTPCIAILLAALLLGGCSGFRGPRITVQDVSITDVTDEAVALDFAIDLENPNDEPLELVEFRYTLAVDGTQVYAGRRRPAANVAAAATRRMSLPVIIPFDRAGWTDTGRPAEVGYDLSGRIVYTAPTSFAQMLFDLGVRRPKSSFAGRGRLRLE